MKISETTGDAPPQAIADIWPLSAPAIAPWWHTILLIAVILTTSLLSSLQSGKDNFAAGHMRHYLTSIAWEWILAVFAWWGIRMRRVPLRQLLGQRRSGWKMWIRDFGIALLFWIMALIVLAVAATVLRLMHLMTAQKAITALAPQGWSEIIVWLVLCITAGVMEEFLFRGYLLQQFSSLGRRDQGNLWLGVVASSLLFGVAHGYEGIGGIIAIALFGAMFSILAIKRRSLRSGMMAHAWHDAIAGIALAITKHLHVL
jgi:uncharacterized protein